jgi:hypothetical protein
MMLLEASFYTKKITPATENGTQTAAQPGVAAYGYLTHEMRATAFLLP